ncbi:class I poly(R)-hydroxyalkanoic acid synthase [Sphingorhabdus soli]|uniref:Class I poly(R)-hydroxyalkanoic acid synthase n=1 Tax=Flavisphingopyxis soli TaxID=2601267 RepID=A0A5C6UP91_9SPHN|nr:class I poly(R)-hydroxyalkanoic acid synthase [Sphingorhabdus soli]TXC74414.1 class I poly(R)-hydroxyalkanoic acid synthase [Sphingorhabdus soli]
MSDTMGDPMGDPMAPGALPSLEDMQHWTGVIGRAQQMLMTHALKSWDPAKAQAMIARMPSPFAELPVAPAGGDVIAQSMAQGMAVWQQGLDFWAQMSGLDSTASDKDAEETKAPPADRRFTDPAWTEQPAFAFIRQSYEAIASQLETMVDAIDGIDPEQKAQMRFTTRGFLDAMSPTNFAATNPAVLRRTIETRGENLITGLANMLADLDRGQLRHTDSGAFEIGRNIAATPGKVIHETRLYQLIQYAPTTETVLEVPLVIFPPWINRFYILDLNPKKSFIAWAVAQGLSVFVVSWKSADASLADIEWDDYVAAQVDAVDTIRDVLDVDAVHAIGYCVSGTTLAATLAMLTARGEAERIKSATFFTAQVDFERAGDLKLMTGDEHLKLIESLETDGYYDGRYMAATFNALRGRDLIWNYVVNNYLMGEPYPAFDMLHWNGDTTNLPAKWHRGYLKDLYRDNKLVVPGAMVVDGTPIDLTKIKTPAYIQAGREDHIAPAESVWRMMDHLAGPKQFTLAGSGHIAGVINHPDAKKYGYWTNDNPDVAGFEDFVAGATQHEGSWWTDWIGWIREQDYGEVAAKGARIPGKGKSKAIEDAPGRYVKTR